MCRGCPHPQRHLPQRREISPSSQWSVAIAVGAFLFAVLMGAQNSHAAEIKKDEYLRFALLHEGDVGRGKKIFAGENKTACSKCHTVDGTAKNAGPDLFAVGDKFGRRELIESVLSPSASIATGYETTVLETKSGDSFTGIIKQATDSWIE